MNPYSEDNSVIVMDNARIHHDNELVALLEGLGCHVVFLSPYSPDFNPIEEAFAELKAWMKKNYLLADGYEIFQGFLEAGLKHMNRKPGSHFRSCHIMM